MKKIGEVGKTCLRSLGENTWSGIRSLYSRLQRAIPNRPQRRLRVSETLALGDKRQLLIVQYGDRQLLIGAAGNFLTTLAESPAGKIARDGEAEA